MNVIKIEPEFRQSLEKQVNDRKAHGNAKYDYMSLNMIAIEIGVSDTLLRRVLNGEAERMQLGKYNKIKKWLEGTED